MSKEIYECLEDRILVIPIEVSNETKVMSETQGKIISVFDQGKTAGGIIVPDTVKKQTIKCEVVNVGYGRYAPESGVLMQTILAKSDIVLCGSDGEKPMGLPIDITNEDGVRITHYLMREGDILLRISKKE